MFPQSQIPQQIGPYKIVGELGRGSMGTVYLASQESLGRQIALKLLGPEFTRDEEFLERFRREGRTGASLRHPNIVQVFDLGESQGLYYIAMEYGGSKDLKQVLHSHGQRLPLDKALIYAIEILSALDHAHSKGIVHRDVKPANIIISDEDHAILTDFSVAQMKMASRLTQTGAAVGTPEYMAPEQFEGQGIDGRCDQYALGIILYEMLTGIQPFHGETVASVMKAQLFNVPPPPNTVCPDIPENISLIIMKSLEKDSNKRYPDANQMSLALQAARVQTVGLSAPVSNSQLDEKQALLDNFLAAVASGQISLDEANAARDQVKAAIDMGYRKNLTVVVVNQTGGVQNETAGYFRSAVNNLLQKFAVTTFEWCGNDAICVFQEPAPAIQAAVGIQQLIAQAAERRPELTDKVKTCIGVHTGEVYLDPRRDLGEYADLTMKQCSTLARDCPAGSVRVGETTRKACEGQFQFKEVGVNADQVPVFEVVLSAAVVQPKESIATGVVNDLPPNTNAAATVATPRFCPGCAKPIETGRRVCSQCGYEVGSLVPTAGSKPSLPAEVEIQLGKADSVVSVEPSNEVVVPKGARLDLSSINQSEFDKKTPVEATKPVILNAPQGFGREASDLGKAIKPDKPQQSLFEAVPVNETPTATKQSVPPKREPSAYAEFVSFAIKATGISGFACLALSFSALLINKAHNQVLWMSLWLGGTFGLPCLALGAFLLFLVSLIFVRDTQTTVRALIVAIGLSVGTVVSALMAFH